MWRFPFPSGEDGRGRVSSPRLSAGGTPPRQPAGRRRYGPAARRCCPQGWDRASRFVLWIWIFGIAIADCFFSVGYGRRDHIAAAGPLAQIDEAAAIAAEREVGVGAFDRFLADGAAEFDGVLTRHTARIVERRSIEERIAGNGSYKILATRS